MPTTISETDTFPATIQRPSNGELADAASLAQFADALAKRTRYAYNRGRIRLYDVTRAPYNADPTGVLDASSAISAAMSDASSGGGDVFFPGLFLISAGIVCPPFVNMIGIPYLSRIRLNHATDDLLKWNNGSSGGVSAKVSGIAFDANLANTGRAVWNASGTDVRVIFENCSWNEPSGSSQLNGNLFYGQGPSVFTFNDCYMRVRGTGAGLLLSNASAHLNVSGGEIVCPATYANSLIYYSLGGGSVRTKFDFAAHSSGTAPTAVAVSSGPDTPVEIVGNRFTSALSGPAKYALSADSGCNVTLDGNVYYGVNRLNSVGQLFWGSKLELFPDAQATISGSAYTVSTGVRSQSIRWGVGSTAPTVTLPPILFHGQELDLSLYNASGVDFGFSLAGYGLKATQPTLFNATGVTGRFIAADGFGTGALVWVQVGNWAAVSS